MARMKWIILVTIQLISVRNIRADDSSSDSSSSEESSPKNSEFSCGGKLCTGINFVQRGIPPSDELQSLLRGCINNKCDCPPDRFSLGGSYGKDDDVIKLCVPKLLDTGKSCTAGCNSTFEKCSSNNTCLQCQFGHLSPSTGECEDPILGDVCARLVKLSKNENDATLTRFSVKCTGDRVACRQELNKCACNKKSFYDESKNGCVPLPSLTEDCTKSKKCLDDPEGQGYTKCSESNLCVCKGTQNNVTKYCHQWPGGRCKEDEECPEFSYCGKSNTCVCRLEYDNGGQGECLQTIHNKNCEASPTLSVQKAMEQQRLICMDGQYQCEDPLEHYYEGGRDDVQTCRTFVGSVCDPTSGHYCAKGASCVNVNGTFSCQCDSGHSSTPDNKCFKHVPFGESCDEKRKCNFHSGVVCMGTCRCPHKDMRFDTELERCLNSEGKFCGTLRLGEEVQIGCEPGLKCMRPKGRKLSRTKCLKSI